MTTSNPSILPWPHLQIAPHWRLRLQYMNLGASQVVIVVKNMLANAGDIRDTGLIPGSRRSPGGGNGNPLWCSCLENPTDRGAWQATVHRVAKNQIWLKQLSVSTYEFTGGYDSVHSTSNLFTHHFFYLQKKMTHGLWKPWVLEMQTHMSSDAPDSVLGRKVENSEGERYHELIAINLIEKCGFISR